jgi:hypothetical protein
VRVPVNVDDVQPLDERKAHELLPRMIHNQLSRPQEKDLMWHMLVCPGCLDEYIQMKQSHGQTASDVRRELLRLAHR